MDYPSPMLPPAVSPKSTAGGNLPEQPMPPSNKPKSKFTFDPLSMLLPHERAARGHVAVAGPSSRQSASAQASTSLVAKAQQTRQSMHATSSTPGYPQPTFPISPPASQVTTPPIDWSVSFRDDGMQGIEELHPDESVSVAGDSRRGTALGLGMGLPPSAQQPYGARRARLEDWEIVETLGKSFNVAAAPSLRPRDRNVWPCLARSPKAVVPANIISSNLSTPVPVPRP